MRIRQGARPVYLVLPLLLYLLHGSNVSERASQEALPIFAPAAEPGMLMVGEELEYKVSYLFFNLGKIRIRVVGAERKNDRVVYKTEALIDSNMPIIADLHIRFESELDEDIYSYWWVAEDSTSDEILVRRIAFDYDQRRVVVDRGRRLPGAPYAAEEVDTIPVGVRCQDGLSLFFYARQNVRQKKEDNVPTFIDTAQVNTYINFMNEPDGVDIDAVDYDVEVVEFDGRADFVGVFGLTGGFEGAFSNDSARVPIRAYMNVILGSIKVELTKWNRPGWVPPRFVEE